MLIKGDRERQKEELMKNNILCHLQGKYFMDALLATVGNMFSGKSAKKHEYPEKPYDINKENRDDLSEDELQKQRELFVSRLMVMKANYELENPK